MKRANHGPNARLQMIHDNTIALTFNLACLDDFGLGTKFRSCDPYFTEDGEIVLEMFEDPERGQRRITLWSNAGGCRVCVTRLLRQQDVKFQLGARHPVRSVENWLFVDLEATA